MEVGMSLKPLVRLTKGRLTHEKSIIRHSFTSTTTTKKQQQKRHHLLVVEAKGKKGMMAKQYQRSPPPPLPKLEDDGNPKFVIFIRMANVYLWSTLNIVTGGTTAKIMVAAKDNFLGKYIYKDTLARNLAAVVYNDEKEIQNMAKKQFRVLRSATEFKYGYKLVVIFSWFRFLHVIYACVDFQRPAKDELKTVVDKVKDFFGDAKESFGKMTFLNPETESSDEETKEKST
ncbi:hypothetical protein RD792_008365 [Penstemon davidsonii]|uniref:Protein HHL1, chloroplastic n=1 Tax=Penstemon davidsonii TaxID=160366 RepID=A0ABR0D8Z1_9LAMI|nr:hypothetical protein RD792_008365 [Penstemon davidsonii]